MMVEHIFMGLFAIYTASLMKCLFVSFVPFLIGLFWFLTVLWEFLEKKLYTNKE